MEIRTTRLLPGTCYHIFNRGINRAPVFFESKNYSFFLQKYAQYVSPFVETYAYCLLENHYHLLIRVKTESQLEKVIINNSDRSISWYVSNGFGSFLQSYTRAMNKVYHRTGALFETPFKRIEVKDEIYFTHLITYIHHNPEKHGIIDDFKKYPYSSYYSHLHDKDTKLEREKVLKWFGNKSEYESFHAGFRKEKLMSKKFEIEG